MTFLYDPTIWVLFSFIIFVVAAYALGRKSIVKSLDDRIEAVRAEIALAEQLKQQAHDLLNEYQRKQADAVNEAGRIVDMAKDRAKEIRAQAEEEFTATMARKEAMMKERISRMEEAALDDIRRYAADLAISATTQIIAQKMDASAAEKLTDASIAKVSENLN